MSNVQHSLLNSITAPNGNAANEVDFPLYPLFVNRRRATTSVNSYGFSFSNPSPKPFGFARTPSRPNPTINPLPVTICQPSFLQTNYNGLLSRRPNNSDSPDLHTFLNNRRTNIIMGGLSEFDHRYGRDYSNFPVMNSMDFRGDFRFEGTRNLLSPMQQIGRRPMFRCVQCGKSFPTSNALGGHKSYHSKMRKMEALKMRFAHEANADNSVGASTSWDRPIDLENEVRPSVPPPLKIRKLIE